MLKIFHHDKIWGDNPPPPNSGGLSPRPPRDLRPWVDGDPLALTAEHRGGRTYLVIDLIQLALSAHLLDDQPPPPGKRAGMTDRHATTALPVSPFTLNYALTNYF